MNIQMKRALCATSALCGGLLLATSALAQTTGSATVEELVVTGASGPSSLDGIIQQTAPKTRTTIDQEFIARQMPGQTVADSLNVVPGYNFTNNDAYGNSGGNIRLRSFDGPRISFQWDGMQLNDSGNYAIFTNQVGDSEIVSAADVAQGTTDVDAPSASATGGSINYRTKVPDRDFHAYTNLAAGSFGYGRAYGEIDSGEIGPWGTRLLGTASYTKYDKFKGEGELEKTQFNARIYQPIRDNGDFASLAFHWNKNRNNQYNNPSLVQYGQFGYQFDQDAKCIRLTPVAGTAQNENNNTIVDFKGDTLTGSCTGYYGLRINPSDTGNIRGQFKYHLRDNVIFTLDPNFQYVLANGGGFLALSETDGRIRGAGIVTNAANTATGGAGKDLNGDGDTLDTATVYTPNNTNTRRYGLNSSLIWDITDDHRVRLAYAYDRAQHRQTGEYTFTDTNGNPLDVFGGKDGHGPKIGTADGSFVRGRDRYSVAGLNMFAAEYVGHFMDGAVELRLGVRAPFFKRELNNFCYSQNGSSTALCTTQPTLTTVGSTTLTNGNVFIKGQGTTQYIAPYSTEKKYDDVLPNVSVSYKFGNGHSVYGSYAEGLSAPRTDNLYTATRGADGSIVNPGVQPETTQTLDIGWRYTKSNMQATVAVYDSKFQNRIVSSFDVDLNTFIDRNIGEVKIQGVDAGISWQLADYLTYAGTISYNKAEVQSDTPQGNGTFLPTKGKRLVETPDWQWFQRVQWDVTEAVSLGVQAKWVGQRYSTDVNDEKADSYGTVDADLRWSIPHTEDHPMYVQVNVRNLFDDKYLGSISSVTNAQRITFANGTTVNPGTARYALGAPRTFQVSLHAEW